MTSYERLFFNAPYLFVVPLPLQFLQNQLSVWGHSHTAPLAAQLLSKEMKDNIMSLKKNQQAFQTKRSWDKWQQSHHQEDLGWAQVGWLYIEEYLFWCPGRLWRDLLQPVVNGRTPQGQTPTKWISGAQFQECQAIRNIHRRAVNQWRCRISPDTPAVVQGVKWWWESSSLAGWLRKPPHSQSAPEP